jgi:hypothetical protein
MRLAFFLSVLLLFSGTASAKCADYPTWAEAQAALEAGARRLDGDKDGVACESLPGAPKAGARPAARAASPAARASRSSYSRDAFGAGWADADGDCQNTRAEVLAQLSTARVIRDGCRVVRGRWIDPYTGRTFLDASDLDVDHVVPLAWAWRHGADAWSNARRERFANDLANLQPTDAGTNRSKGDKGPDEWLPPEAGHRCEYVLRFTRIALAYGLLADPAERSVLDRVRARVCG